MRVTFSTAALLLLVITLQHFLSTSALIPNNTIRMVEGHSVHRIASSFRSKLVGRKFSASSPNGRFADGAAAIDGRVLSRMEAVGKNLFAFFSSDVKDEVRENGEKEDVVVHVHFGMSGAWAVYNNSSGEEEPEVKATTRLRLEEIMFKANSSSSLSSKGFITHLSAMTVAHGDPSLYSAKKNSLGQDPLRSDADPDFLYSKIAKSKKSIGQLLMDQSYFAGPGNIYRAEILFLAGVYPTTLGVSLDRESFNKVWDTSVKLLRRGYDTGSILTVDATIDPSVAAHGERRYIYNKSQCARCGGRVSSWDMSGRTCYACESGRCQPKLNVLPSRPTVNSKKAVGAKDEGDVIVDAKGKKKTKQQQPKQHVPFISHCAPISYRQRLERGGAGELTISEIRFVMEELLENEDGGNALPPKSSRKAVHVEALNNLLCERQQWQQKLATPQVKKEKGSKSATVRSFKPLPPPMVSAEDAAREKAISGENRAVEHVAELSREQATKVVASITPSPAAGRARGGEKKSSRKRGGNVGKKSTKKISSRRKLKYDE
mmetsp:Transcript_23844/g.57492  ORF Transcript_23844/g.57492 Transcript_23844/m.57492 type:complete len:546 (-) Transcript_23844:392-2029(-)